MKAIEIKDWNSWYGHHHVLKDVCLEFDNNAITAIVGPSGCGKTTLLRSLNRTAEIGTTFKCKGEILVAGENIYSSTNVEKVRRKIGLVYQTPIALPLSIKENVLFGPRYYEERNKKKLNEILESCLIQAALWDEVKDNLNKPASHLSGGQKQRLSIARALAVNPKVLLLDEPCSSLDPNSTHLIEQLIIELSNNLPIVIVTHNLFQARRVANETVFMLDGKIVEKNKTEAMFTSPHEAETKKFFSGLVG
ncbi:Phosphate ABC transporter, ATP-binding protein PstB [Candidatus Syntrophocurvum alkaliphilum]|uniref:Phosphate ABC transporter, ATP-binding protein PstB n=1 Tax=Candidatus Syntrophocurvum alkaliphilum TaxID=2293317 RepID=A0A6I6DM72_9FIRM|nr:phosphate ABC transporter ATP-binding protein [Candidatus Syntrophocurvum alkaliphilum]QGU00391.1 Phosphate ABC transporter, ATP-binding protein PstB [Candidatus Syntrophocurvum alkaliphilum]